MPATLAPRQRRRRFTERTLLDRIRKYEDLLRQNHVTFQPLQSGGREDSPNADISDDSHDEQMQNVQANMSTPSTIEKSDNGYEARYALLGGMIELR